MAINAFVNNTRYQNSNNSNGSNVNELVVSFPITVVGNASGDILRICTLPSSALITEVTIGHTAITALTDVDLGIYETLEKNGAVISANLLADGLTFITASRFNDGLSNVSVINAEKDIRDLANLSSDKFVDVALTLNTTPSVDGSVSVRISYVC